VIKDLNDNGICELGSKDAECTKLKIKSLVGLAA
jgi:hypothetical protein